MAKAAPEIPKLANFRKGPLGPHLDDFATLLSQQGYCKQTAWNKLVYDSVNRWFLLAIAHLSSFWPSFRVSDNAELGNEKEGDSFDFRRIAPYRSALRGATENIPLLHACLAALLAADTTSELSQFASEAEYFVKFSPVAVLRRRRFALRTSLPSACLKPFPFVPITAIRLFISKR